MAETVHRLGQKQVVVNPVREFDNRPNDLLDSIVRGHSEELRRPDAVCDPSDIARESAPHARSPNVHYL